MLAPWNRVAWPRRRRRQGYFMGFNELEVKMRALEAEDDAAVAFGLYIIARLDGRGFTRLVRERFDTPQDERFRDLMVATTETLMQSAGLRVIYGHTQSDEISLLVHPIERAYGRKRRKLHSILAGLASARFSLGLDEPVCFDCRLVGLDRVAEVADYFYWRSADALRNARNAHCYWALRSKGLDPAEATEQIKGLTVAAKLALLEREGGVRFDELPAWQRYGVGVYWEPYAIEAPAPVTGMPIVELKRRLTVAMELPERQRYRDFVRSIVEKA